MSQEFCLKRRARICAVRKILIMIFLYKDKLHQHCLWYDLTLDNKDMIPESPKQYNNSTTTC